MGKGDKYTKRFQERQQIIGLFQPDKGFPLSKLVGMFPTTNIERKIKFANDLIKKK